MRFWIVVGLVLLLLGGCNRSEVSLKATDDTQRVEVPKTNLADQSVAGETPYIYKHRDTSDTENDREQYIWELLELALEATVEEYGEYVIVPVEGINQVREDQELMNDSGVITIISDSLNKENLERLDLIHVPLLRQLLGYRVFLIREDMMEDFQKVKTADDLRKYSFGIALGWNDKIILDHAAYSVFESPDYKSLFRYLSVGKFDVFSRGVGEVGDEYEAYSDVYPNMAIEEHILLYYPLSRYFGSQKRNVEHC